MDNLILAVSVITALWSGFFMGFYKREGKAPELPTDSVTTFIDNVKKATDDLTQKRNGKKEEDNKANSFYN